LEILAWAIRLVTAFHGRVGMQAEAVHLQRVTATPLAVVRTPPAYRSGPAGCAGRAGSSAFVEGKEAGATGPVAPVLHQMQSSALVQTTIATANG